MGSRRRWRGRSWRPSAGSIRTWDFFLGLTHDVGRAVILAHAGRVYRACHAYSEVRREALVPVIDAFHARFSGLVASSWRMVPEVVTALSFHHQPQDAPEPGRKLAELVHAVDLVAQTIQHPDDSPSPAEVLNQFEIDEARVEQILEEVHERYENVAKMF